MPLTEIGRAGRGTRRNYNLGIIPSFEVLLGHSAVDVQNATGYTPTLERCGASGYRSPVQSEYLIQHLTPQKLNY